MTHRERFLNALNHKNYDRIPIDYLATREANEKIIEHFKARTERELLDIIGSDFYYLSARDISQNEGFMKIYRGPKLEISDTKRKCPFGITYGRSAYDFKFGVDEPIENPLRNAESPKDIIQYPFPKPEWFDPEPLLKECEDFNDRIIISGFWTAIFGNAYRLYGFEKFLMDMVLKTETIKTLIDKLTDFYLELNERLFKVLSDKIDIFFFGNDFGSQNGLLFSEDMWHYFFYENYKKIISLAHSYGLKVMVHSCGSIFALLPRLIEVGADLIDPVQTTAKDMEPEKLKSNYGDKIVFHGAVDTQNTLAFGNVADVVKHTRNLIEVLGKDGGYVFCPSNDIQSDTPVENVKAMYMEAQKEVLL